MSHPTPKTSARLLAPLALIACALAVLVVVTASTESDGTSSRPAAGTAEDAPETEAETRATPRRPQSATYTVEPGDTLGAISEETGVEIQTLLDLNPELDPQALIAGQEIKLRE